MRSTPHSEQRLADSYENAVSIMKKHAASFYEAFRLTETDRFRAIAAVYAFCRYADDLVDLCGPEEKILTRCRLDELEAAVLGSDSNGLDAPWWPAFVDTAARRAVPVEALLRQIEGQRRDLDFTAIETFEELIEYCELVAGSVGLMLAPMLLAQPIVSTSEARIACESLGVGMQITNILRDIGEDLRERGRIYMPAEMMARRGVCRTDLERLSRRPAGTLREEDMPRGFIELWEELAETADRYYDRFFRSIARFAPDCRLAVTAAAVFYRAIGDAVRGASYDCLTRRCRTDDSTKKRLLRAVRELVLSAVSGSDAEEAL